MTILAAIPAVLAVLLWVTLMATLLNLRSNDAAGNGLAQVYAVVNIVALWALLLTVVIIGVSNDGGPGWMKAGAFFLCLASGAAATAAFTLLTERNADAVRWVIIVPAIVPLLLVAYGSWAFVPALRAALPVATIALALGVPTLVLSLAPWLPLIQRVHSSTTARTSIILTVPTNGTMPKRAEG
jgi:hypothetical protein